MDQPAAYAVTVPGGHAPYLYHWSGLFAGSTEASVSDYLSEDGWVNVEVVDAEGHFWQWSQFVDVNTCGDEWCTRKTKTGMKGNALWPLTGRLWTGGVQANPTLLESHHRRWPR
jgi:hypothetical protein